MNSTHTVKNAQDRLIIALDFPDAAQALDCARELSDQVSFFKVGLQLYTAAGPEIVRAIAATGAQVFLDLKLHDIPNTVAKAVAAAGELNVAMLTVHLSGGSRMIEAAVAACPETLLLLGVTVLTSADEFTLSETGITGTVAAQTVRLAEIGAAAGIRGLIASPRDVAGLRERFASDMTIITPGVRPTWSDPDDQKRFTTPGEALQNGADYLVIGRPITAAADRVGAVRRIVDELTNSD